nr:uncharacterized protein LOC129060827 [Pongo abelii]
MLPRATKAEKRMRLKQAEAKRVEKAIVFCPGHTVPGWAPASPECQRRQPQVGKAQAKDTLGLGWGKGEPSGAPTRPARSRSWTGSDAPCRPSAGSAGRWPPSSCAGFGAAASSPPRPPRVPPALLPAPQVLGQALDVPDCRALRLGRQVCPRPLHIGLQLSHLPLVPAPEFRSVRSSAASGVPQRPEFRSVRSSAASGVPQRPEFRSVRTSSLSAARGSPSTPASSSSLRLAGRLVLIHLHLVDDQPRRLLRLLAGHLWEHEETLLQYAQ